MKRVSYIFPTSHHYRLPFHELLRKQLAGHGVAYKVIYCNPGEENCKKRDTVDISWGTKVSRANGPGGTIYQHALREAMTSDLVIVQQESRLILNYLLNLLSIVGLKKVAYFGHGRNFQARDPNGAAERWKRFWATKVDWWFGYTEETRHHIISLGFPADRITVFNNAVDTSEVRAIASGISPAQLAVRKDELGITSENVGIFVGGLYEDKRLAFLIEAADRVRVRVPDFSLILVGAGEDFPLLEHMAASRSWMKVMGPRFGVEKIELMKLGRIFMMPGLVGLAVLDAGAAGLPTITTAFPYHSPEIAYVEDGYNGLIVPDWQSPEAYADAVVALLETPDRLNAMRVAAEQIAQKLTIDAMVSRFAEGVLSALES